MHPCSYAACLCVFARPAPWVVKTPLVSCSPAVGWLISHSQGQLHSPCDCQTLFWPRKERINSSPCSEEPSGVPLNRKGHWRWGGSDGVCGARSPCRPWTLSHLRGEVVELPGVAVLGDTLGSHPGHQIWLPAFTEHCPALYFRRPECQPWVPPCRMSVMLAFLAQPVPRASPRPPACLQALNSFSCFSGALTHAAFQNLPRVSPHRGEAVTGCRRGSFSCKFSSTRPAAGVTAPALTPRPSVLKPKQTKIYFILK